MSYDGKEVRRSIAVLSKQCFLVGHFGLDWKSTGPLKGCSRTVRSRGVFDGPSPRNLGFCHTLKCLDY